MKIKLLFSIVFLSVASFPVFTKSIMNDVIFGNSTQIKNNTDYIEKEKPVTVTGSNLLLGENLQEMTKDVKRVPVGTPLPSISTDIPTTVFQNQFVEFGAIIRANGNQGNVILRSTFTGNDMDGKVDVWYKSKINGSWNLIPNPGSNFYEYGPFKLTDANANFRIKAKQVTVLTGSILLINADTKVVIQEVKREVVVNPPPSMYVPLPDVTKVQNLILTVTNIQVDPVLWPNTRIEISFTGTDLTANNEASYQNNITAEWIPMDNPSGSISVFGPFTPAAYPAKFLIKPQAECEITVVINLIDNVDNSIVSNYSKAIKISDTAVSNDDISKNVKKLVEVYPIPSHDLLNIDIDQEGLSVIEVWSISGRLVYEKKNVKTKNIILNVENWDNGLYFIKAIGRDNTEVLRFIKY